MDRIVLAAMVLVGAAVPAFAAVAVPQPTIMSVFGLGLGGAYLFKRYINRT